MFGMEKTGLKEELIKTDTLCVKMISSPIIFGLIQKLLMIGIIIFCQIWFIETITDVGKIFTGGLILFGAYGIYKHIKDHRKSFLLTFDLTQKVISKNDQIIGTFDSLRAVQVIKSSGGEHSDIYTLNLLFNDTINPFLLDSSKSEIDILKISNQIANFTEKPLVGEGFE